VGQNYGHLHSSQKKDVEMKSADNYKLGKTTGRKINCDASPECWRLADVAVG